jgi:hypothetical protein
MLLYELINNNLAANIFLNKNKRLLTCRVLNEKNDANAIACFFQSV